MSRRFMGRPGTGGGRACAVLLACIGVGLVLGVIGPLAAPAATSFASPKNYPTGHVPNSVAFGDLNGDGKLDLAIANAGPGEGNPAGRTVSVLLNRGDGRFGVRRDYRTGLSPTSVAIGDLNGDGKMDLATANEDGNSVSVLLNAGDGSFQTRRDFGTGGRPYSVAIGDVNEDGKLDLASANAAFGEHTISVLLNRVDGNFEPKRDYPVRYGPEWVTIGDLNGDGKPDLAFAGGGVSVLLNGGGGTFEAEHHYPTARGTGSVAIGDLNRDGKADLATASVAADTVSVLLNRGDGSFGVRRDYRAGSSPFSVTIGDVNGDGTSDLLTANDDGRSVSVLANTGNGTFQPKRDYRTGPPHEAGPVSVALGDVNGDRRLDAATANQRVDSVSVLINTPGLCNVQNVLRLTLVGAKRVLASTNCRVGRVSTSYSKRVKKGHAISQKPSFGAVLPTGGKVNLVISRGRKH